MDTATSNPKKTPTLADYKLYTRKLKAKVERLKERNENLIIEVAGLKKQKRVNDKDELIKFAEVYFKMTVKIQTLWRGFKARRNYHKLLRKLAKSKTPIIPVNTNEYVMSRINTLAEKRRLSLEMLYRACDLNSEGVVRLESFKVFIQKMQLGISNAQLARFLYVIDEDCRGYLSMEDFYTTLAAYGVNSEVRNDHQGGRTYEQYCLLLFTEALSLDGIQPLDSFRTLDQESQGSCKMPDFFKFMDRNLTTDFKQREKYALFNYLDAKNMRSVYKDHYLRQIENAQEILSDPEERANLQIRKKNVIDKVFDKTGTNLSFGGTIRSNKFNNRPNRAKDDRRSAADMYNDQESSQDPDEEGLDPQQKEDATCIISKIQKAGSLSTLLLEVLRTCDIKDKDADMQKFNKLVSEKYSAYLSKNEMFELGKMIDRNGNGVVDVYELRQFFKQYTLPSNRESLVDYNLKILANEIDALDVSTSHYLQNNGIDLNKKMDIDTFTREIGLKMLEIPVTDKDCTNIFKEIHTSGQGKISIKDFIVKLQDFRTSKYPEYYEMDSKIQDTLQGGDPSISRQQAVDPEDLIKKINSNPKYGLVKLFHTIAQGSDDPRQGMDMMYVKEAIQKVYQGFLSTSEIQMLQESVDGDKDGTLTFEEITEIVADYVPDYKQKIQINFMIVAVLCDYDKISTEEYLLKQNVSVGQSYNKEDFCDRISEPLYCLITGDEEEGGVDISEIIYDFLKADSDDELVTGQALADCINNYRIGGGVQTQGISKPAEKDIQVIKNDENNQDVIIRVHGALAANQLSAPHLFTMANDGNKDSVTVINLKNIFKRMLPELTAQELYKVMRLMDINCNGFVDRKEYQVIMMKDNDVEDDSKWRQQRTKDELSERMSRQNDSHSEQDIQQSYGDDSLSEETTAPAVHYGVQSDNLVYDWVRELRTEMTKNNINQNHLFGNDTEDDINSIDTSSIFWYLTELMPSFPRKKIIGVLRFLDTNENGFVDSNEFMLLFRLDEKTGGVLDESIAYTETEKESVTEKIKKVLKSQNQNEASLFNEADGNRDGLITIMDLKRALNHFFPDDKGALGHKERVAFLAQVLEVFKEGTFELTNFKFFMDNNRAAINHTTYTSRKDEIEEGEMDRDSLISAVEKLKSLFKEGALSKKHRSLEELMHALDTNNDNSLDAEEFDSFLKAVSNRKQFSADERRQLMKLADKDGNGVVSITEFCDFMRSEILIDQMKVEMEKSEYLEDGDEYDEEGFDDESGEQVFSILWGYLKGR